MEACYNILPSVPAYHGASFKCSRGPQVPHPWFREPENETVMVNMFTKRKWAPTRSSVFEYENNVNWHQNLANNFDIFLFQNHATENIQFWSVNGSL